MSAGWGERAVAPDCVRFRLWAPALAELVLEIDGRDDIAMASVADGWFEADADARPGARYRYRLPDGTTVPDPASRAQDGDVHGWSVVVDPDAYRWRHDAWRGRPWEEAVIYELHVGLCGGFAGVAKLLSGLAELGVTAVELMPVNAFSGTRNWGYDGVLPYAPATAYGSPDELKALVDTAHGLGLMMFLDVVYNHFGPDGNFLNVYAPDFFDEGKHTPWGGAVAVTRPPVAGFFIDNARMWIEEYRFDGLRFDAVHAIRNDAFLDAMAIAIRAGAGPDRHVHLVLENENNDVRRLGHGHYDAQWNDDFHHCLHVMLTGETDGYYRDYADHTEARLARCLAEGFVYQGEPSANLDGKPRGTPSAGQPTTRFVACLQNHDQIGNRAMGDRLTMLADPDRLRVATALLLLSPQVPMLFMGEEAASETPFLFFTDFHDDLADAVREGRRKEFAKFPAFQSEEARERIPDPNALATFERSRPEPGTEARQWRTFYREMLAFRRERIVPRLQTAESLGSHILGDKAVSAEWRLGDGAILRLAINLGDRPVGLDVEGDPMLFVGALPEDHHLPASALACWISEA